MGLDANTKTREFGLREVPVVLQLCEEPLAFDRPERLGEDRGLDRLGIGQLEHCERLGVVAHEHGAVVARPPPQRILARFDFQVADHDFAVAFDQFDIAVGLRGIDVLGV